jgi:hypothetical protein
MTHLGLPMPGAESFFAALGFSDADSLNRIHGAKLPREFAGDPVIGFEQKTSQTNKCPLSMARGIG